VTESRVAVARGQKYGGIRELLFKEYRVSVEVMKKFWK